MIADDYGDQENEFFEALYELTDPVIDKSQEIDQDSFYHYTNFPGFMGILQSKKLWMTQVDYLNDASEFREFCDSFESRCEEFAFENKDDVEFGKFLSSVGKFSKKIQEEAGHVFISSFSSHKNSLNQWRAYGGDGGICIEFTRKSLDEIKKANGRIRLVRCSYSVLEQESICDDMIRFFKSLADGDSKRGISRKALLKSDMIKSYIEFFLALTAPLFKNPAFAEEGEYRFVKTTYGEENNGSKYRLRNNLIVPYTEINISDDSTGRILVDSIRVGPGIFQDKNIASIRRMLEGMGQSHIKVRGSLIPYRNI